MKIPDRFDITTEQELLRAMEAIRPYLHLVAAPDDEDPAEDEDDDEFDEGDEDEEGGEDEVSEDEDAEPPV